MDRVVRFLDRVGPVIPVRKPSVAEWSIRLLLRESMVDEGAKSANTVTNSAQTYEVRFPTHPDLSKFCCTVASGKRVVVGPACEQSDGSAREITFERTGGSRSIDGWTYWCLVRAGESIGIQRIRDQCRARALLGNNDGGHRISCSSWQGCYTCPVPEPRRC